VSAKFRRTLTSIAFIAGFAPLIWASPSDPSSGGSGPPPAPSCPADDRIASNDLSPQREAVSLDSRAAEEVWLAERERLLSSLVEVRRPDGSVSVDLQEAFWSRVVMQRNPDGSISIRCFPAGSRVVLPLAPAHPKLEEK
jgi:hypothetical protein